MAPKVEHKIIKWHHSIFAVIEKLENICKLEQKNQNKPLCRSQDIPLQKKGIF